MTPNNAPILDYAPETNAGGFASLPRWIILLIAIMVPGLPSVLIRGRRGFVILLELWAVVVLAFFFFGPLWGDVIFAHTKLQEAGLWPFLATCVAVAMMSAVIASRDVDRVRGLNLG